MAEANVSGEEVAHDAPVDIRAMTAHDAPSLVECFHTVYGDSYELAWAYDAAAIAERLESGEMLSVVAVDPAAKVVGHLGLDFADARDRVAESAHAVIDPAYRGHHLFESMKSFARDASTERGLFGLYSEATAAHPYSQRGNLALGAHELGFLLGFIPEGIEYAGISDGAEAHRLTIALFYLRTNPEPNRMSFPPRSVASMVARVYENAALVRALDLGEPPSPDARAEVHVTTRPDHRAAYLNVLSVGENLHELVEMELDAVLALDEIDCAYLDLPLGDPATPTAAAGLEDLGFFFGCVIPELRPDGDVLRLQLLHQVDPHPGEISTASDFGRDLLADILANAREV